jgi:microcystin-dependent protein
MADNVTANYGWVQPEAGASATTWGTKLNSDLALIDAQVFTNQAATNTTMAAMVPIGAVVDFVGTTAPTNYLMCDGSQHSTATYPVLSGLLGGSGGTFNVPDLRDRVTLGAGVSYANMATGGEATHVLTIGEVAAHAHGVSDPTHTHGLADPGHVHGVNQSPHAHGISDPGHAHGFTQNTIVGGAGLAFGQNYNLGGQGSTTAGAGTGIGIQAQNANVSIAAAGTGQSIQGNYTGISTQNAGSGAAHNNMQPFYALNKIIRAL